MQYKIAKLLKFIRAYAYPGTSGNSYILIAVLRKKGDFWKLSMELKTKYFD